MMCALNMTVLKQHKTDISIESGILILPVLSYKDYRVSVLYSRPDIYRAQFQGYGQIHGKPLTFCEIFHFLSPEGTFQI